MAFHSAAGSTSRSQIEQLNARDGSAWVRCARRGDFAAAWALSDAILERTLGYRDWSAPREEHEVWNGTPLAGRRVLIRCYRGLGDTIQFIRYAPIVRAFARDVTVWAQPALLPLLETMAGIDRLLPLDDGPPDAVYDVDAEVMELPYVFRTTLATVPYFVPYLTAEPAPLPPRTGPRVGIVWRAAERDPRRSIPFDAVATLLDLRGIAWYQLQHDVRRDERHAALSRLNTEGLVRTAQYMRALDLVISIDSMPAHLAGALAMPVWTLLTREPDWRWMQECDDSPWYPTMRLFRQSRDEDWEPVIEDVRRALVARFGLE